MNESTTTRSGQLLIVLLAALVLYFICLPLFYVGYFTDDALFISLSHSILHGSYSSFYSPSPRPVTDPLPGFPALLAACRLVFGNRLVMFKFVSVFMTLACAFFLYLLSAIDKSRFDIAAAALFALNPLTVRYASTVMSEPSFMTVSVLAIWLLDKNTAWSPFAAGAALGVGCYFRPQGILLLAAAALFLLSRKQWRALVISCATASLLLAPFLIRNYLLAGETSGYVTNLQRYLFRMRDGHAYFDGLKAVLGVTFPNMLFQFPLFENHVLRRFVAWASIAAGLTLMTCGAIRSKYPAVRIGFIYSLVSLLTLPVWFAFESRYVLILLPWIALSVNEGLKSLPARWSKSILIAFAFTYTWGNILLVQEASASQRHRGPDQTMAWIRDNTGSQDRFLSQIAPVVNVYTQRKCETLFISKDFSDFVAKLRDMNISYVLVSDDSVAGQNGLPGLAQNQIGEWVRPGSDFSLVYERLVERMKVFKVITSATP